MMNRQERMIDLIDQMENMFSGHPWYGQTWIESLERIPVDRINFRLAKGPSIASLLEHVVIWREYVVSKLHGDPSAHMEPGKDWPEEEISDTAWQELVRRLVESQQELLEGLSELPASELQETVPGLAYSWNFMLQGLIDHDAYHLGQINLLTKQVISA